MAPRKPSPQPTIEAEVLRREERVRPRVAPSPASVPAIGSEAGQIFCQVCKSWGEPAVMRIGEVQVKDAPVCVGCVGLVQQGIKVWKALFG